MPGYLKRPESTLKAFENLWFHTGDLASLDTAGYFFFKGRKKDAIRHHGENISGWEVEQILRRHPSVVDAVAVGWRGADGDEDVWVLAVPDAGSTLTESMLLDYCRRSMPKFMIPRFIELREALPKTPTGRVEKHKLLESGPSPGCFDTQRPAA
jgi:crotonobetaine/carnitine-CoA ligase